VLSPAAYTAIAQAEGTFRGGQIDYDTLLGCGKWGRPDKPITTMSLQELSDFGMQMRRAPGGRRQAVGADELGARRVSDHRIECSRLCRGTPARHGDGPLHTRIAAADGGRDVAAAGIAHFLPGARRSGELPRMR
jgi:hypothetical protein